MKKNHMNTAVVVLLGAGGVASGQCDPTGETITLVSLKADGGLGLYGNGHSDISGDGRFVALRTRSPLTPEDTNDKEDIFVRDLVANVISRVSVNSQGAQASDESFHPSLSHTGRYVAFASIASNLVPNDTNFTADVFVHDRETGETIRVSVGENGEQANGFSAAPAISGDGRYVAFVTTATNLHPLHDGTATRVLLKDALTGDVELVSVDENGAPLQFESVFPTISADGRFVVFDTYRHADKGGFIGDKPEFFREIRLFDRMTGVTKVVSVSSQGVAADDDSSGGEVSSDGRFVVFQSVADNLVVNDVNNTADIFIHDRITGETSLVSLATNGEQADDISIGPSVSGDGRYVVFWSRAVNLDPGAGFWGQMYRRDRLTGVTERISVALDGGQANNHVTSPSVSVDGRHVAFITRATNLVPCDTQFQEHVFAFSDAPPSCPADLTGDDQVNGADLANLLSRWGQPGPAAADLNGDGVVDGADLANLLSQWGACA